LIIICRSSSIYAGIWAAISGIDVMKRQRRRQWSLIRDHCSGIRIRIADPLPLRPLFPPSYPHLQLLIITCSGIEISRISIIMPAVPAVSLSSMILVTGQQQE
jgi:hypothetical protein